MNNNLVSQCGFCYHNGDVSLTDSGKVGIFVDKGGRYSCGVNEGGCLVLRMYAEGRKLAEMVEKLEEHRKAMTGER